MAVKIYPNEDAYYKKTIVFKFWGHNLQFKTSQELFSSDSIDLGTQLLLRTIVEANYGQFQKILDLGCGYGPLGITLKSLNYNCCLHMVDKDALAVDYSIQNTKLNGLNGIEVYGSLGYDEVKRNDFDLIVSNIPGKSGESAITYFITEAASYLTFHGLVAMVVVAPLEGLVSAILGKTPGIEVVLKRSRPGHVVYHYRFIGGQEGQKPMVNAIERGIYQRNDTTFSFARMKYLMQTAYGLPEFDTLSYGTEMILNTLKNLEKTEIKSVVVLNPGQGHVPVIIWQFLRPQNILLIDRDLLALRYSSHNLILNGFSANHINNLHRTGIGTPHKETADIIVIMLREEGILADSQIMHQASSLLASNGVMFISARSTAITRLIDRIQKDKHLIVRSRERRKGFSSVVLQHD